MSAHRWLLRATLAAAASAAGACAATGTDDRPAWLQARIAAYEAGPARQAPFAIWRLTRGGAPAYLVISPCCDQFDPLLDAQGATLCHPQGGITGRGDGRCPFPADRGTPVRLVWLNPSAGVNDPAPPVLARP